MAWTTEQLRWIYDRSSGYCHICHKKLARKNYGKPGERGAWEVEHSKPRATGGTDHGNNLYPSCIPCNRKKQAGSTKAARAANGKTRAPLSVEKRKAAKVKSARAGGLVGAAVGTLLGPVGTLLGTAIGAHLGSKENPDKVAR